MRLRGRPPSAAARTKALRTAHDILMQEGFGRLTIEAVSLKSGVGKPTIYRNWANASELAMAALMAGVDDGQSTEVGTFGERLRIQMRSLVTAFATTRGRQIALTLAAADPESEMTKAFRNRVILSSRERGRQLLEEAVARSEVQAPDDIEVLLDMIYAPIFYRLLVGHMPLTPEFAEGVARAALAVLNRNPDKASL